MVLTFVQFQKSEGRISRAKLSPCLSCLPHTYKIMANPILIFIRTYIIIKHSMCVNPIKSIWIAVIIAIVLLLVASPGVAASSVDRTVDNLDSDSCQEGAAVPLCCLMADCPLSHCILTKAVNNECLLPNRSTPKENVDLVWSPTSVTAETSINPKKPFQLDPIQELPSDLFTAYHCRNCLSSEEPSQV